MDVTIISFVLVVCKLSKGLDFHRSVDEIQRCIAVVTKEKSDKVAPERVQRMANKFTCVTS